MEPAAARGSPQHTHKQLIIGQYAAITQATRAPSSGPRRANVAVPKIRLPQRCNAPTGALADTDETQAAGADLVSVA